MLIIAGYLEVAPANRDAYVADCHAAVAQARRAPGCFEFTVAADPIDVARITVYERWASDEDLARFRGAGPPDDMSQRILGARVRKYRISATEDP